MKEEVKRIKSTLDRQNNSFYKLHKTLSQTDLLAINRDDEQHGATDTCNSTTSDDESMSNVDICTGNCRRRSTGNIPPLSVFPNVEYQSAADCDRHE